MKICPHSMQQWNNNYKKTKHQTDEFQRSERSCWFWIRIILASIEEANNSQFSRRQHCSRHFARREKRVVIYWIRIKFSVGSVHSISNKFIYWNEIGADQATTTTKMNEWKNERTELTKTKLSAQFTFKPTTTCTLTHDQQKNGEIIIKKRIIMGWRSKTTTTSGRKKAKNAWVLGEWIQCNGTVFILCKTQFGNPNYMCQ